MATSPADRWAESVPKTFMDEARGLAVMPTRKEHGWWWAMGEVALDWVHIPVGSPLLVDSQGEILHSQEPMRLVGFDAFRHKDGQDKDPEDTHTQPQNKQKGDSMDDWDLPLEDTRGPSDISVCSEPESVHNRSTEQPAVLLTRTWRRRQQYCSEFKHRGGRGKLEERGVQVVGDLQQGPDTYQTGSAHRQFSCSIDSVIQADEDWPEGEYYRQKLM